MENKNMNLKETYDKIAEDWHRDHLLDDWWVIGIDKFISFFKKGDLILDVGCGSGTKASYFLKNGLNVVGFDLSPKMIEIAKREVPGANFLVLDLGHVDELEYSFDGILMQAILLHVPKKDVEAKLKDIIKKLKSGGYLYIAVKEKIPGGVDEEVRAEDDYGYKYERFFSYFTLDDFIGYFKNLGIELIYKNNEPPSRITRSTPWLQIIGRKK